MLKGKPAGEPEHVTMSAIRNVLSDFDDAKPKPRLATSNKAPTPDDLQLTTRPVKTIEAKIVAAQLTTVPMPEEEKLPPVKAIVEQTPKVAKAPAAASAIPSPASVARKVFRLPRLPKIDVLKAEEKEPRRVKNQKPAPTRLLGTGHIIALAVIVLVAFQPGLVATVVFLWFAITVALFLFCGADRIWRAISWVVQAYSARNKAGADALLDWLDTVAVRWDSVLDRFPDGLVESLYMPDFANLEKLEEDYDKALDDRLERMHRQV